MMLLATCICLLVIPFLPSPTVALIVNRRRASAMAIAVAPWVSLPPTAFAEVDAGESIRRGASNIPGYGPSDVFYPRSFLGKWKVVREIVGDNNNDNNKTVEYEMRFISSVEANTVVADRGFNQAALEKALSGISAQSYEWSETNPNDLRLVLDNGTREDIKVTKRASERTEHTVSSSEFQRIMVDQGMIPALSAQRTLCKWKVMSETNIEGLEIIYDMGGGDPLSGTTGLGSSTPALISKARLHLERLL